VFVEDKYCISVKGKRRYIIPLVKMDNRVVRINEVSEQARDEINGYLDLKFSKYTGFDFDFKPVIED
jgi:hypothetical protein